MTGARWIRAALPLALAAALGAPSGAAGAASPIVSASVATKDGTLIGPMAVRAKSTTVKIGRRRCAVAAGTPLAALVALKTKAKKGPRVGRIALKDYGSCGKRPSRSSRLYLTGIGADRASGPDGWIYDVNGQGGSTSAADPAGPLGRGRIKAGSDVSWRWCRASEDPEGDCGDRYEVGDIAAAGTTPGVAATLNVSVLIRTGADGDAVGTTAPAPAGVVVRAEDAAGRVLAEQSTDATGHAVLAVQALPSSARIVVASSRTIAPAGTLWPPLR